MADFDAMETFVAVMRASSFRGAAQALHIPRSTVSQRIARLEERLSARLLERTTRAVRATPVGRAFFDHCVRILADVEEAERAIGDDESAPRGVLRVASSLLFGHVFLSPVAAEFARKHPNVEIEVVAVNRRVNLVEEGFDLAVTFMEVDEDSSLISRKLESAYHAVCASPAYLAEHDVPKTPENLREHQCVVFGESRDASWRFERDSDVRRIAVHGRMSVSSFWMAHDAAIRGVGIAAIPLVLCGEDLRAGRLVSLFPDWRVNRTEMRIVYPSNRYLTPRVRLFVDALVEGYNASIDQLRSVQAPTRTPVKRARPSSKNKRR
jgi:DNA-binding transcriptional LysR family regulator